MTMDIQNQMEFITKARNKCGKFYLWYICTVVLYQYEELLSVLQTFLLRLSLLLLSHWLASWWLFGLLYLWGWLTVWKEWPEITYIHLLLLTSDFQIFLCFLDSRENRMGSGSFNCVNSSLAVNDKARKRKTKRVRN